jgi:transposase-like protein
MGVSNKIQDTNLDITQFTCSNCSQKFTDQDKTNDNWEIYWDTSNDVEVQYSENSSWLKITAYARDITHKPYECPEIKKDHDKDTKY